MKKTNKIINHSVTIAGKEYKIPQSWEEISVDKYLKLRQFSDDAYNESRFLSIMLDCPINDILKNPDPDFEFDIFVQLEWYRTKPIDLSKLLVPPTIKIGDKELKVPKDIGFKSYGQKTALQDRIKIAKHDDPVEIIPYAIAIYFYGDYYGTDELPDDDLIEEFKEDYVLNCSIVEAYPVGYFFLMRFAESMSSKLKLLEENILPKRKKQRFGNWKSLVSSR